MMVRSARRRRKSYKHQEDELAKAKGQRIQTVPSGWKGWSKRVWLFLWKDDSISSWIANLIIAFLLIKFIFYPLFGLVLGTQFPVVAVVSSSMEHHPFNFDAWWMKSQDFYLSKNITKFEFLSYPFDHGFNKGDIMILSGADVNRIKKGTVIVYWSGKKYPIIHRFIGKNIVMNQTYLMSKGDNNPYMIRTFGLDETRIPPDRVVGKAILRIPLLGYVKIWFVDLLQMMRPVPN